ncbi:aldehyde ferredoxin oxidoreductase family protein [Marispirochaeta sp.]|uniref:aldehyde ferredoxin oxidoreductase family protein n=1 Tax=Marispirochaeta sp. TaxID=2038653 RepID=UPI0029C75BA1|nr:aldehyde ferredoxin oxidoreductase family protein [Marispirochaeta sp.]
MKVSGAAGKYLFVDLTAGTWKEYPIQKKNQRLYLGGKGLAIKIYYDLLRDRLNSIDPLGAENLLIFSTGVLLGTKAPCSARFEVLTKSPLTNLLVGSSCGGPFGEALRTAGWDGLILSGKSRDLLLLRVSSEGVSFESAAGLAGLGTEASEEKLKLDKKEAAVTIGPAGENLVRYANIRSGHRFAGRGGVGAVMGAKKLKAVVVQGWSCTIEAVDPEGFRRISDKARKMIQRNPMSKAYKSYGTAANVRFGMKAGFSPVRNFRDRYHPDTKKTSGESMAERYSPRSSTCRHCVILCGHKGEYPDGKTRQIPEYETVGMFGSNIANYDPDLIGLWNEQMNDLGMDTISAGGTIAWAMEAAEKGLRPSSLRFGDIDGISEMIRDITFRHGEGYELAEGTRILSEKYGGREFAIQVKGLECAAYDPRAAWGQGLSYAVYNKGGCHLGSYLVGLEQILKYMPPHTTLGKASWAVFCENLYAAINSLQICQFTSFGILTEPPIPHYVPRWLLRVFTILSPKISQQLMDWTALNRMFSTVTGIKLGKNDFLRAGERITKLERWVNLCMSETAADDTLPARFTEEKQTRFPGKNTVVPIQTMVKKYYRLRKYSSAGTPRREDLERLMEEAPCPAPFESV